MDCAAGFGPGFGEGLAPRSPLTSYALAGLRRCWMPEHGTWSHKYHLDGRQPPNESVPHSDLYYSLNVLLGLSKVRGALAGEPYDVPILLDTICRTLPDRPIRNGAWGIALWAAAELELEPPAIVVDRLRRLATDVSGIAGWTAQDIGLTLSGAVAQARGDASWTPLARALSRVIVERFRGPHALFRDSGQGPRRHFATFASQVYAAMSLYQYGELAADAEAIAVANACAVHLIKLQGCNGEWPWFFSPDTDRVLEPYEVYSVHQHGMAPALLHHAVEHGVAGAREAIERGFEWIFGANEMKVSMLVPRLSLIYRSQARRGFGRKRGGRIVRAALAAFRGGPSWSNDGTGLCLTEEMRSYEFGWLLWSFGNRSDYRSLSHRMAFAATAD